MIDTVKKFFKELKRVRWPKAEAANKTFWISMTFIVIASLILFALALLFTAIWNRLGVGLNG